MGYKFIATRSPFAQLTRTTLPVRRKTAPDYYDPIGLFISQKVVRNPRRRRPPPLQIKLAAPKANVIFSAHTKQINTQCLLGI